MTSTPIVRHPAVVVALVAMVAHANALANGFVLDDRGVILQNPLVQEPVSAWRAFTSPYWPAPMGGGQYRPLGIVSFALDHAIAGNRAWWFHLVNLGWHAGGAVLVHRLATTLVGAAGALAAGLVFAVHPVHVEAVANVVGRLELMAAALGMAMLLLHRRRSFMAPVFLAGALLSKESAVVFPLLAWAMDRLTPAPDERPAGRLFACYGVVLVAWLAGMLAALGGAPLSVTSAVYQDVALPSRMLTVMTVIPHYVRLLVAPFDLSADYEPGVIRAVETITPAVVLGLLLLTVLLASTAVAWRREPRLALALAWVAVAIAPVSNLVIVTGVALAERTLYLASAGVALAAGWMVARSPARMRLVPALLGVVLVAFTARTWLRTPAWRDSRSYALQLLADRPESYRAHWVAGRVLRASGELEGARREFALARSIYPRDTTMLREYAEVSRALGHDADAGEVARWADSLTRAREAR